MRRDRPPMSEQMKRLLESYGVTTERALVGKIQDEYEEETGERPIRVAAEVILDEKLEAEFQRIEGAGRDPMADPREAYEFEVEGIGHDPASLEEYEARPAIERYGTIEHEAWLLEMEREEA